MLVLPVLDLLNGQVVHGIAGQRSEYHPIVSQLTSSSDPRDVALALRDAFGFQRLYVADLDGILQQKPNLALYRRLIGDEFDLFVDAGIRHPIDVKRIQNEGVTHAIIGLESCLSPDEFAAIADISFNLTFSLDLLAGVPRKAEGSIGWSDVPSEIVRQAIAANAKAILPLDLADVGMGTGGSTDFLCRFIRTEFPAIGLITGGGVRGVEDLSRFNSLEVDAVLVATALHDGSLTRTAIRDWVRSTPARQDFL